MLTIPSRMDRLEATLDRLAERVDDLAVRLDQLTSAVNELTVAVRGFEQRMARMDGRMGNIEGELLETRFDRNMPQWVVDYLQRPERVYIDDLAGIASAVSEGLLTLAERREIANPDSMIRGLDASDGLETVLAIELSATINTDDVERAEQRTGLLNRAGVRAKALVCGYAITQAAESLANERKVLVSLRRRPA
jgi:outer membrane murein-binding lipoprotein Lpp